MTTVSTAPYGAWPSPIDAGLLARASIGLSSVAWSHGAPVWLESRPAEGGRSVVVRREPDGTVVDLVPDDFDVRTLAHEYGGGAFALQGSTLFAANFADQRWYRFEPGGDAVPVTPEPGAPRADRYADAAVTRDGRRLYAVRERHGVRDEAINELVIVDVAGGEPSVVADGHDFFSYPRISPDGRRLAWTTWDHPRMPWDATDLWLADIATDGSIGEPDLVAGGPAESVLQPEFGPDGALYFCSDRTGWWNLYRHQGGGDSTALYETEAEFGGPQWVFGLITYQVLDDGRIACIVNRDGVERLCLLAGGNLHEVAVPYTAFPASSLAADGQRLLFVGASPAEPAAVVLLEDPDDPEPQTLRRSSDLDLDERHVARPEPISFPTAAGARAHAAFYPPTNGDVDAGDDELPPLLVISHGGPTSQSPAMYRLSTLYWTTRGFAVVDVNYRGSTGYGRAYREALYGAWGVADVQDCIAAATWLADQGRVDRRRMAIRGGSAGGYTTLCALVFSDVFAAGTSYYGVADPALLAQETHKFESRYLDQLIGPWPQQAAVYRERAPIHHLQGLSCPVLLLQGLEDAVVPPSQAEHMVEVLRQKGLPHAYIPFQGERHGFRNADSIQRAHEAELSFYGQVLGFTPAGDLPWLDLS